MAELARAAEEAGFDRLWVPETVGRDALLAAHRVGAATSSIGVATGIAYAFTRPPLAMAGAVSELVRDLGGRFELGLGSGTRGVRRRYGVAGWERPGPDLAAYVAALRETSLPMPAVHGAATNPLMAGWVGAACDGLLLLSICTAPGYLQEVMLPALGAGAARAARPRPRVTAWLITAVDADESMAREEVRRHLAFYFSTPSYRGPAERLDGGAAAAEVRRRAEAAGFSDWKEAAAAVPAEWCDLLAVYGTPETLRERADSAQARLRAAGVDEVVFQLEGRLEAALSAVEALSRPAHIRT